MKFLCYVKTLYLIGPDGLVNQGYVNFKNKKQKKQKAYNNSNLDSLFLEICIHLV